VTAGFLVDIPTALPCEDGVNYISCPWNSLELHLENVG